MFSKTTIVTINTKDLPPGSPGLSAEQVRDHLGRFTVTPPEDAVFSQAVVLHATAEEAELYRDDFEGALALADAQVFDPLDGPSPSTHEFDINHPGEAYSVLARSADHPHD